MTDSSDIHIIGYSDRLSARPGESIEFKVSSRSGGQFQTRLARLISADPNPGGVGMVEENCDQWYSPQQVGSRIQPFFPGSYAVSDAPVEIPAASSFTLSANIFATLKKPCDQVILSLGSMALGIDAEGGVFLEYAGRRATHADPVPLRRWLRLEARVDLSNGGVSIKRSAVDQPGESPELTARINVDAGWAPPPAKVLVAAKLENEGVEKHFNGKIEAPLIQFTDSSATRHTLIAWDFSRDISSVKVHDSSGKGRHGALVNFPMRAVTGSNWSGRNMCWRHAAEEYAAVHFHDDDICDFGWRTDFCFKIPAAMPSGAYVMHIEADGERDSLPFFVCPPAGSPTAEVCVLIPTFTYAVYGNHARPDYHLSWREKITKWKGYPHNPADHRQYGLSTYNFHSDGSGIAHASHLRPLFNLRPGYLTFGYGGDSGLRHLPADTHLISWLHAKEIDYDIITDNELHREGISSIAKYRAVLTATHPEYHTYQTLDALKQYTHNNGHLLYLGGNGFYWRIARHREHRDILEVRRTEGGIRAWAAEPGEYYSAFDGLYGGLWRRIGRPPQRLVGVGFTAQGNFTGSYYRRKCFDPEYDWVFDQIEGGIIGDFGFSGGGAAGFELDRADEYLGTPSNAVVLASSEGHEKDFMLVPEEQLTHLTNLAGRPHKELLRADMIYFTLPGGGSVFSAGSITFCGSLPWNNFNNSVSRLLQNMIAKACSLKAGASRPAITLSESP